MPRKSRQRTLSPTSFLKPIPFYDLGTDKDPCFGKLYDLTAPECQACGDVEFCAAVNAQGMKTKRIAEEKKSGALDLEMDTLRWEKQVKEYYEARLKVSGKRIKALLETVKKFKTPKDKIKTLI